MSCLAIVNDGMRMRIRSSLYLDQFQWLLRKLRRPSCVRLLFTRKGVMVEKVEIYVGVKIYWIPAKFICSVK